MKKITILLAATLMLAFKALRAPAHRLLLPSPWKPRVSPGQRTLPGHDWPTSSPQVVSRVYKAGATLQSGGDSVLSFSAQLLQLPWRQIECQKIRLPSSQALQMKGWFPWQHLLLNAWLIWQRGHAREST